MRTEVILHETCLADYRRWYVAMQHHCEGQAVSVEMLSGELREQLRLFAGRPGGAKFESRRFGGDELWVWNFDPRTTVRYLIRDRKSFLQLTKKRRVILLQIGPPTDGGPPQDPSH